MIKHSNKSVSQSHIHHIQITLIETTLTTNRDHLGNNLSITSTTSTNIVLQTPRTNGNRNPLRLPRLLCPNRFKHRDHRPRSLSLPSHLQQPSKQPLQQHLPLSKLRLFRNCQPRNCICGLLVWQLDCICYCPKWLA